MSTLAHYLERDGLLVITIRPVEYWHHDPAAQKAGVVERQVALHRETGFCFLPHQRAAVDGDITYGGTSLTTQWLSDNFSEFSIKGVDRSLDDSFQYYVILATLGSTARPDAGLVAQDRWLPATFLNPLL